LHNPVSFWLFLINRIHALESGTKGKFPEWFGK
jgi:hypothetical protein